MGPFQTSKAGAPTAAPSLLTTALWGRTTSAALSTEEARGAWRGCQSNAPISQTGAASLSCLPYGLPHSNESRGLHLSPSFLSHSQKNYLSKWGVFLPVVRNMEKTLAPE